MIPRFRLTAVLFASLLLGGCVFAQPRFDVSVRNVGTKDLDHVQVAFPGFAFLFGVVPPGVSADYLNYRGAFPTAATVRWTVGSEPYAPVRTRTVPVPTDRPELQRGRVQRLTLEFRLDGDSVSAEYSVADYTEIHQWLHQRRD